MQENNLPRRAASCESLSGHPPKRGASGLFFNPGHCGFVNMSGTNYDSRQQSQKDQRAEQTAALIVCAATQSSGNPSGDGTGRFKQDIGCRI
jgi:hypothetical protein